MDEDNLTRLENKDVLDTRSLKPADRDKINALTKAEVDALISVRNKLGRLELEGDGGTPWIL